MSGLLVAPGLKGGNVWQLEHPDSGTNGSGSIGVEGMFIETGADPTGCSIEIAVSLLRIPKLQPTNKVPSIPVAAKTTTFLIMYIMGKLFQ